MEKIKTPYAKNFTARSKRVRDLVERNRFKNFTRLYHIGVDPNTNRIIFATEIIATANSLLDINYRTSVHYGVNYSLTNIQRFNIDQSNDDHEEANVEVADTDFDLARCWEWAFKAGKIVKDDTPLPQELIDKYQLIVTVCLGVDYVHKKMRFVHRSVFKDLPLQQTVYLLKKEQAELVIKHNVTDPIQVPFVQQWADIRSIDVVQAAKEIMFAFNDMMYRLVDAEKMRLTFVNRIKACKTEEEVFVILDSFDKENTMHSYV